MSTGVGQLGIGYVGVGRTSIGTSGTTPQPAVVLGVGLMAIGSTFEIS